MTKARSLTERIKRRRAEFLPASRPLLNKRDKKREAGYTPSPRALLVERGAGFCPPWAIDILASSPMVLRDKYDPLGIFDDLFKTTARELVLHRRIPLFTAYAAPSIVDELTGERSWSGSDYYQRGILENPTNRPYYPKRVQDAIIDQHDIETKDCICIDLGPLHGEPAATIYKRNGLPKAAYAVDDVKEYLDKNAALMKKLGIEKVGSLQYDFFSKKLLTKLKKIIGEAGDTPVRIFWLGNTAFNFPIEDTKKLMKDIRAFLRPGDIFYIGGNSTLHEGTLVAAYKGHGPWLKNSARSAVEVKMRLYNRDSNMTFFDTLNFVPPVKVTGECHSVMFQPETTVDQLMYYRLQYTDAEIERKIENWPAFKKENAYAVIHD